MPAPTKLNTSTGLDRFTMLSLLQIFICEREDWTTKAELIDMTTSPVWKDVGDTKNEATFVTEEVYTPVLTQQGGNSPVVNILSDATTKVTMGLSDVNATVKQYISNVYTATGIELDLGKTAKEFSIRIHPTELGTDYSKDIILPRCSIKVKGNKTSKFGEYEILECEVSSMVEELLVPGKRLLALTDLT